MPRSYLDRITLLWRARALAWSLLLTALLTLGLWLSGEPLRHALSATAHGQAIHVFRARTNIDSLAPMSYAYNRKVSRPGADLYDAFFLNHVKFQYPPCSLLPLALLPRSWTAFREAEWVTPQLHRFWTDLSFLAVVLTVSITALILEVRLAQMAGTGGAEIWKTPPWRGLSLSALLGFTFYPLIKGYGLGQVQVFVDCLVTFALLFHVLGQELLCAACLGACALVKPQWCVLLLWGLLRRRWRFCAAFSTVLAIGVALSMVRFGMHDHARYFDVLRYIESTGEVYWPNQSVNGLLNRLFGNGDAVHFDEHGFASARPIIRILTLVSSFALLGLALWPGRGRPRESGPGVDDLALALVAATIASPVAWEHHYGALLPVFAFTLPELALARPLGRATAPLLAFSYLAAASVFLRPEILFANRTRGLLGSHLFFGGASLYALLVALRSWQRRAESSRLEVGDAPSADRPARRAFDPTAG
jgi:alpha-1,2-mannosyltransferase